MSDSDLQSSTSKPVSSSLIAIAWLVTLLVSILPEAIFYYTGGPIPAWLLWAKVGLLIVLVILSWPWKQIQPLRSYFILLGVLILAWWSISWIRTVLPWQWEEQTPWAVGMLGIQLLKFGVVALLTVVVLFIIMRRRQEFFLTIGQLDAMAEPVRWLGMKEPVSWTRFGPIVAVVATLVLLVVLALTNQPSATTLVRSLPLLPMAVLLAATNAVSEEVSYRASLLAPLHKVVGKRHALLLTAVFFGLAHIAGGVPAGMIPTVLMTGFLGWLMGKSMLETRGFFWAWLIHFITDIPVFAFLAMDSVVRMGQ